MSEPAGAGLRIVRAGAEHLLALTDLIFDHGANIWNYLPEDAIREHLVHVVQGRDHGVLAPAGWAASGRGHFRSEPRL